MVLFVNLVWMMCVMFGMFMFRVALFVYINVVMTSSVKFFRCMVCLCEVMLVWNVVVCKLSVLNLWVILFVVVVVLMKIIVFFVEASADVNSTAFASVMARVFKVVFIYVWFMFFMEWCNCCFLIYLVLGKLYLIIVFGVFFSLFIIVVAVKMYCRLKFLLLFKLILFLFLSVGLCFCGLLWFLC